MIIKPVHELDFWDIGKGARLIGPEGERARGALESVWHGDGQTAITIDGTQFAFTPPFAQDIDLDS